MRNTRRRPYDRRERRCADEDADEDAEEDADDDADDDVCTEGRARASCVGGKSTREGLTSVMRVRGRESSGSDGSTKDCTNSLYDTVITADTKTYA